MVIDVMAQIIGKIQKGKGLPEELRCEIIKPIYKNGDIDKVENYSGITIMDSGYKIYAEWLREKLIKEIEEKKVLNRTQFGFRKGN